VTTQPGIFALGTPEHGYPELDLEPGRPAEGLVRGVAGLTGPLSSTGGVNLVVGFRPELRASVAPGDAPVEE
jgi:putative iron-dependent peroxidase